MTEQFRYQKFYLRCGICGVPVLAWIVISPLFIGRFETSLGYWLFSAGVTVLLMLIFYKASENLGVFNSTGVFGRTGDAYDIEMNGKKHIIRDVDGLYAWKISLYGTHLWALQISCGGKRIKLFSESCAEAFPDSGLYRVYLVLLNDNPQLKQESEPDGSKIPYFYSR